ncbi:MAG: alpha-N-arabinofuranosidase, partial [Bacteroidales bacterium]|nr:alpha-N-arabinofuranosidase [Bacteroidales bacterium]
MANIAQVVNVLQSMILTNDTEMVLTPTYHVFKMYNVHQDAEFLDSDVQTTSVKANRGGEVPAVSATASRKDGVLNFDLVNTDLKASKKVLVKFDRNSVKSVTGASILTSGDVHDFNNFGATANKVSEKEFKNYKVTKDGVEVTLPPCSIVAISMK